MKLMESLMDKPMFAIIATAILFTKLAIQGVDVRPWISALVDDILPALA
jgi:hypothetical protein